MNNVNYCQSQIQSLIYVAIVYDMVFVNKAVVFATFVADPV